jgi:hypothetical protein
MAQRFEIFESRDGDHFRRFGAGCRPPHGAHWVLGAILIPFAAATILLTLAVLPLLVWLDPRRRARR